MENNENNIEKISDEELVETLQETIDLKAKLKVMKKALEKLEDGGEE